MLINKWMAAVDMISHTRLRFLLSEIVVVWYDTTQVTWTILISIKYIVNAMAWLQRKWFGFIFKINISEYLGIINQTILTFKLINDSIDLQCSEWYLSGLSIADYRTTVTPALQNQIPIFQKPDTQLMKYKTFLERAEDFLTFC